jgi:hypothetical protein
MAGPAQGLGEGLDLGALAAPVQPLQGEESTAVHAAPPAQRSRSARWLARLIVQHPEFKSFLPCAAERRRAARALLTPRDVPLGTPATPL